MSLKSELKQLKQRDVNPAVSILLPTHRTFPDSRQDAIVLKNLISDVERRLQDQVDKATAAGIVEALNAEADAIDHNWNLDALALFAGSDGVTVSRYPFTVKERAVVDHDFATRDLVRAISDKVQYLVLVLAKSEARLVEGFDDRSMREFDGEPEAMRNRSFPVRNDQAFSGDDRTNTPSDTAYLREYFNRVDKSLQELQGMAGRERLPVILLGDASNVALFKSVSDRPDDIIGDVTSAADLGGKPEAIIAAVQPAVDAIRTAREDEALQHVARARSAGQLHTDLSTIYRLARSGNAARLFVQRGFIQPGVVDPEAFTIQTRDAAGEGVMDDVVDELVETVLDNGGDVHFVAAGKLDGDDRVLLESRY